MFTSQIGSKEFVINDENWVQYAPASDIVLDGEIKTRGRKLPRLKKTRDRLHGLCSPFSLPLIPRSEWKDRIEAMERTKTRLSDLRKLNGLKSLDQNGTNFCLTSDTKITSQSSRTKNISEICIGDSVLTAEQNIGIVTQVFKRFVDEDLFLLHFPKHSVKMTGRHPVLTNIGYVQACDLNHTHKVVLPKTFANSINYEDDAQNYYATPFIERRQYTGFVYNLEVSKNNSYVSNGIGVHNCWANGPISALHILQIKDGGEFIPLSPASVAAPIKNFRNEGGWGLEAMEWIAKYGVCPTSAWPNNAINRSYYNAENKNLALQFRVKEWDELTPRNLDELMTMLLMRIPVAVGYSYWSHEVCAIDPVYLGPNQYGVRIWNSWGDSWSDNGMAVLTGSRMIPDDAVAPRVFAPN